MSTSPGDPPSRERPSRVTAVSLVALVLALVAVGLSAWALYRSGQTPQGAQFSAAEQADAKVTTCAAAGLVRTGVAMNTNLQSPGGAGDVTGSLAAAANARVALSQGGQYLLARVVPATPPELADAADAFANTLLDIGAAATAGALNTDPDQAARLRDADTANARLAALCS